MTIVPKLEGSSPTSSRSQSEDEYELPCEGDLLVVRHMLGHIQKPFDESQREIQGALITTNYVTL